MSTFVTPNKIKFRAYLDEVCAAPLMGIIADYLEPYECFVIADEMDSVHFRNRSKLNGLNDKRTDADDILLLSSRLNSVRILKLARTYAVQDRKGKNNLNYHDALLVALHAGSMDIVKTIVGDYEFVIIKAHNATDYCGALCKSSIGHVCSKNQHYAVMGKRWHISEQMLLVSALGGHVDAVNFSLKFCSQQSFRLAYVYQCVAKNGNVAGIQAVMVAIKQATAAYGIDHSNAFLLATQGNSPLAMREIRKYIHKPGDIFNEALIAAAKNNAVDAMKEAIVMGATNVETALVEAALVVPSAVDAMREAGAQRATYNAINSALVYANTIEAMEVALDLGAGLHDTKDVRRRCAYAHKGNCLAEELLARRLPINNKK